jgi:AraC-like DNA-binding protein
MGAATETPMGTQQNESRAVVRSTWLKAIVDASQRIAGQCALIDADEVHQALSTFMRALPVPAGKVECIILRAVLLDVASRCGEIVHARADRRSAAPCGFEPATILLRFWNASADDPRRAFLGWIDAFAEELLRTHPPSAASRAARAIRDDYQQPWTIAVLARRLGVSRSQLRRNFQREFGVSIREYQRTMRLIEAMPHVSTEKIEAIALKVGYKSKKNFYRAFQDVTGLTPTAFRNLSEERALHLVESIRAAPPRRAHAADRRQRSGTIADRA